MERLTTKYVYDFDGKKVSEEETEVEEENPQEKVKNWQCVYCGTVVASPSKPPTANCPACSFDCGFFLSHYWQYLGDAQ